MKNFICIFFLYFCSTAIASPTEASQSLHLDWIDKKISPQHNFYGYANGRWQQKHPIPDDYSRWGIIQLLEKKNQQRIHELIKKLSQTKYKIGTIEQKIADFYLSGMNKQLRQQSSLTALQPLFARIQNSNSLNELQQTISYLQTIGVDALFKLGQMQDFQDSRQVIGVAMQSGLGLPDRDYYLEKKFQSVRKAYQQHLSHMFLLLGDSKENADAEAKTVLHIETTLAKASMSRTQQRNPNAIYHIMTIAQLQKVTPPF